MRDLKADLELCQRATPGPWIFDVTQIWHSGRGIDDPDDPHVCIATMDQEHEQWQEDGHFIAAAREGWPEAIRRALEAEKRVRILEHILRSLGVTPNDQAILERHLSEMGVGEEG